MVISQKDRPVGLVLMGSIFGASLPLPFLFYPRPEDIEYTHPSRGTIIQTFDGGFVDDFGEGLSEIVVNGHTGWNGMVPGEVAFLALRDMIVLQYHAQRANLAAAGQDINQVNLYWADTLNSCVYKVYPVSFVGKKNRQRPLLYTFTLRMTGLKRELGFPGLLTGAQP